MTRRRRDASSPGRVIARRMLPVAGVTAILVGAALVNEPDGDDARSATSAPAPTTTVGLPEEVDAILLGVAGELEPLLRARAGWIDGTVDQETYGAEVAARLPAIIAAGRELATFEGAGVDTTALDLYGRSMDLYAESLRVDIVATSFRPGSAAPLQGQLQLLGTRLRVLADRVYDRGHARVAGIPAGDGSVEVRLPDDVPDWVVDGQAPGPPLAPDPPPADSDPGQRQDERPEQPEDAWVASVAAAGIPDDQALAAAMMDDDPTALAALADAFVAVEQVLRAGADPEGGRERATVVRLALLVYADAARAAQSGILAPADHRDGLLAVAARLAEIGDELWDPALPARGTTR